jgi:5-methylcytosine-specific restriction endonuclease McrA
MSFDDLVLAELRERPVNKGQFQKGQHWRPRQPWWDCGWLEREYVTRKRSSAEIAKEYGVTDSAIQFWLHKHGITCRTVSQARAIKHWGAEGERNPMFGRRGDRNPRWRGGVTPARQSLYVSAEWKSAARFVRRRDPLCRLCGTDGVLQIHHIEPFSSAPLLGAERWNLIRLCVPCHKKVSRREKWWRDSVVCTDWRTDQ